MENHSTVDVYGLGVSVFHCPFSLFCPVLSLVALLTTSQGMHWHRGKWFKEKFHKKEEEEIMQ